ncbi:Phosphatidylinositol 4-kinase LSB6 [Lecanora helva]
MPRHRPPTSGYAQIAQADEENAYQDDSEEEDAYRVPRTLSTPSAPRYAPIQPQPHGPMHADAGATSPHPRRPGAGRRRSRRNSSGVDIKAINARLERWAEEIASKFKITRVKGKTHEEEQLEIKHSVFQAPEGYRPASAETLTSEVTEAQGDKMTKIGFDDVVESVKVAIELGMHPKRISQGSSGSYFARNSDGKVVGVFKPKDEEPYASRNPKWTKWIHRNLFPCFFGRACLIPNLSYVSEAAAYILDNRLRTDLVPYTDIVYLSSKSFHYDFWDKSAYYRKRKPLPAKVGSFQVFLKGFKDANLFLRDHPWPDQINTGFRPDDAPRWRKKPWTETCRPGSAASEDEEDVRSGLRSANGDEDFRSRERGFVWTEAIKQSFREELEKLVILDYIMRNTDRGLDNWMVRVDEERQEVSIVSEPPKVNGTVNEAPVPIRGKDRGATGKPSVSPYKRQEAMSVNGRTGSSPVSDFDRDASIAIGAIDNSLSWPWKHPDAWRSFPFGWLFLPVSLIGQPFSQKTRDHFLPLLTSTKWWSDTQLALRRVFSQDSDFKERMFARQIAVMKGQAWNVVETLKTLDHGPLELTRRTRVCVWDDLVDIPVAIPMRAPSAEVRRKKEREARKKEEEEEMDISTAIASSSAPQHDLLGLSSPNTDLPNPNRFDLSRNNSSSDLGHVSGVDTPATIQGPVLDHQAELDEAKQAYANKTRPSATRSKTRLSFEGHRKTASSSSQRRRYSFSARYGAGGFMGDGDDLEGDLGYSAAEGMEGSHRKVIVERLETVKTKNPVFTWC